MSLTQTRPLHKTEEEENLKDGQSEIKTNLRGISNNDRQRERDWTDVGKERNQKQWKKSNERNSERWTE